MPQEYDKVSSSPRSYLFSVPSREYDEAEQGFILPRASVLSMSDDLHQARLMSLVCTSITSMVSYTLIYLCWQSLLLSLLLTLSWICLSMNMSLNGQANEASIAARVSEDQMLREQVLR